MKITYRDKIIILVLVIALCLGGGFSFFIRPAIDSRKMAETTLSTAKSNYEILEQRVEAEKDLPRLITEAYNEATKLSEPFFQNMTNWEGDEYVKGLLDRDSISIENLDISDYSAIVVTNYIYTKPEVTYPLYEAAYLNGLPTDGDEVPTPIDVALGSVTYDITFSCSEANLKLFLDKLITATKSSLRVNELSFTAAAENANLIEGTMNMTMYFLEPIQEPDLEKATAE